jgi:hypothetical protein
MKTLVKTIEDYENRIEIITDWLSDNENGNQNTIDKLIIERSHYQEFVCKLKEVQNSLNTELYQNPELL